MGLDIYVGSLTRYHTGDWETVIQQLGQRMGLQVMTVRPPEPGGSEDRAAAVEEVREAVTLWMQALARSLEPHVDGAPCTWDEQTETPYFTDKPARDPFVALMMWAAHTEHPDLERPERSPEEWWEAPALKASNAEGFRSEYGHLVRLDLELWLPVDFPFTFSVESLTGREIGIGSSPALRRQLAKLNETCWQADEQTIREWRRQCPEYPSPLEEGAKFAFEILLRLSGHAVEHRLPMLLDY